ncbi:MAG: hypothetical protein RIF33_26550 [Cyclobacteriaceae bacterium]
MTRIKNTFLALFVCGSFLACEQETFDTVKVIPTDPGTPSGESGSADFTKFVTIGNSLMAGVQGGALFTSGQQNSLSAILNSRLALAGGDATFNQPDILSEAGFTGVTPDGVVLGKLILQTFTAEDGTESTLPAPVVPGAIPGPFTGDKAALNNFAVPGIQIGQFLIPETGGPDVPQNPAYNPLYARFASAPGTSTLIGDVLATQPTFFAFWLGNNDVLGFAAGGGDDNGVPITSQEDFSFRYNASISTMLGTYPDLKGVVGNIPNVLAVPYFNLIQHDAIPLDDPELVTLLNGEQGFGGFNQLLDGLAENGLLDPDEAAARKIGFEIGNNAIVIEDTDLTDLGPLWDILVSLGAFPAEQRPALEPYRFARQSMEGEQGTLPAAGVLGTEAQPGNPLSVIGVAVPLADGFWLTQTEQEAILTAIAGFNATIQSVVDGSGGRLALADANTRFLEIALGGAQLIDGVIVTPDFAPPSGLFSADGVHLNTRGYAETANMFIDAINATFGASVPRVGINNYPSIDLPINVN